MRALSAVFFVSVIMTGVPQPVLRAENMQGEVIQVSGGGEWVSVVPDGSPAENAVQITMDAETSFDGYLTARDVKVGDRILVEGERVGPGIQAGKISTPGANVSFQMPGDAPPGSGRTETALSSKGEDHP